jgi:septal ring factor EnvC (AmiA/AmiB activator)
MKRPAFPSTFLSSLLLWAVLSQAFLPPLSSLPSDPDPPNSGNELTRLREISARLNEINGTLWNELETSRQNSAELSNMLETSRNELEQLKAELAPLRNRSAELLNAALNSERELNGLRTALRKAENSLTNLEYSWESYRTTAEQRIVRLERGKRWYIGLVIGSLAIAAAGWTAYAVSR